MLAHARSNFQVSLSNHGATCTLTSRMNTRMNGGEMGAQLKKSGSCFRVTVLWRIRVWVLEKGPAAKKTP
jgi:hypothetical protein